MNDLWPLREPVSELFVAGKKIEEWEAELGEKFDVRYPWDLLDLNERLMSNYRESVNSGEARVEGVLIVGEGTKILPGVYVEGIVVIGKSCQIGPNCYLRGSTAIGDGCYVGQAVEVKNSIIGHRSRIGHLSYLGDSVLGEEVNFGAGTITSNFRHDGKNHRSMVGDDLVETGRLKFGAIVGDGVRTGIHTSIYPGRKIGAHATTLPGGIVREDLK